VTCHDCARDGKETPASHTMPIHEGPRVIALCEAHAVRAGRFHRLTRIEGEK